MKKETLAGYRTQEFKVYATGVVAGAVAGLSTAPSLPEYDKTVDEVATTNVADAPDSDKLSPAEVAVRVAVERAKEKRARDEVFDKTQSGRRMHAVGGVAAGIALGAGGAAAVALRRRLKEDEIAPERGR